jgi:hypothetical protein
MTDDLSPMLPQPIDDNAPMISGRGTKIIADARGAYLAGHLGGVIGRLEEIQQHTFRQAALNFMLWYADQAFQHLDLNTNVRVSFEEIKASLLQREIPDPPPNVIHWGDDDYDTATRRVSRLLDTLESVQSSSSIFEFTQNAMSAALTAYSAERVLRIPALNSRIFQDEMRNTARMEFLIWRYMLEAAWLLLHGRNPLTVQDFLTDERQFGYRSADLESIVNRMNEHQRMQFKLLLIRQGIDEVCRVLPPDGNHTAEHQCLDAAREWLDTPGDATLRVVMTAHKSLTRFDRPAAQRTLRNVSSLMDAIRISNVVRVAKMVLEIAEHSADPESESQPLENQNKALWWQVEAAWAILIDQLVPPIEMVS